MRDDILLKLQRIIEGNDRITWDLFPDIYNGFLEADELSLAEDRMLQLVASAVQTCMYDKVISTASSDKITEYEDGLGLSGEGLTLDERRQQVIDYINRSRVINEETLHSLVQSKAVGYTVYEKTDPQELTLGIFSEEEDDQGAIISVGIVDEIRPVIPQNLELYAGIESSIDMPLAINHAHFSALCASLGVLEWSPVPPPPPTDPAYSYIVFDTATGTIVNSIVGDGVIVVITPSVEMENFYFTVNGVSETEDTLLEEGTYILYDASGNTIDNETTIYNGSLAGYFIEESGNMTVADGEFLEFVDGHLKLNMDGNTRSAWSVQVRKLQLLGTIDSDNDIFTDMSYFPFGTIVIDS